MSRHENLKLKEKTIMIHMGVIIDLRVPNMSQFDKREICSLELRFEFNMNLIFNIRITVEEIRRGQVFAADLAINSTVIPTHVDEK